MKSLCFLLSYIFVRVKTYLPCIFSPENYNGLFSYPYLLLMQKPIFTQDPLSNLRCVFHIHIEDMYYWKIRKPFWTIICFVYLQLRKLRKLLFPTSQQKGSGETEEEISRDNRRKKDTLKSSYLSISLFNYLIVS